MRFNKLDLNLLVALDALLDERSVSRAAERVFLSQPAMSNALARLRTHYGDDLIVAVGRRMVLTERGAALQSQVRELMLQIQRVTQADERFDPATDERKFTIAASDYFSVIVLPPLLRHCAEHAPRVSIDVSPLSPKLSEELDRGEIDLLIVPDVYTFAQHPSEKLFSDEWVCVVWSGNRSIHRPLSEADYLAAQHVVKRENHNMFQPMDELVLGRKRVVRRIAAKLPQYSLVPHAVVGTERLATVQGRLARELQVSLPIEIFPMPFDFPALVERMQWHSLRENDLGNRWLREAVLSVCRGLTRPERTARAKPRPPAKKR